ncbi:MAG: MarR family winged helix-turn-helix transcriptional regulator [Akkermansiaceae bacterium]
MNIVSEQVIEKLPQQVAWRLFLTVHAITCSRIDENLQLAEVLSFDDYDVLLTVNEAVDETLRMSELADAVLLSKSGMSRRVTRLVERGLLKREKSRNDGRVFRVQLTKSGRKALAATWAIYSQQIEENFANHISEEEGEILGGIFQRVLNRIGSVQHAEVLKNQLTDAPK